MDSLKINTNVQNDILNINVYNDALNLDIEKTTPVEINANVQREYIH